MSNFKSAEHVVRGQFEIMSMITPELYGTGVQLLINPINNKI